MSVWTKFRNALRAFRAARGGNVAITFAFATLPIIATVGYAVDYSRANSVKVAMQAALDSTALMISKEAAKDTPTQLQDNAKAYFLALFNRTDVTNITVNASFDSASPTQVSISSSVDVPTTILAAVGWHTMTVGSSSTSKWGETRMRVALVLDNTGSMASSGKMTALKSATKSLLTQLQNAVTNNGDVYVSIVPFVKDVNLDPSEYNSDWIYWGTAPVDNNVHNPSDPVQDSTSSDNTSWNAQNGTCSRGPFTNRGDCKASPICSKTQYTTQTKCQSKGGTWYTTAGTWTPYAHNDGTSNSRNWNGCVTDRGFSTTPDTTNNYDTNVVQPDVTKNASLYAAEQYSSCPQAVMGLSYNWSAMTSLVNGMSPNGSTNQAIGLQLGWLSLVGGGPFTAPAMQSGYNYSQVIILLTDGLNTQDRWYGNGSSLGTSDDAKIDAREQLTCNNFKAAGSPPQVTNIIYTIQVNTDNEPTSTLLQNCASDSSKFFLLTSADQIMKVFTQIGTELSQLRIAQ